MQTMKQATACLLLLGGLTVASPLAHAQSAVGTLNGRVTDSVTREVLPGATVAVEGTILRTAVAHDGTFLLTGVPAGTRRTLALRARSAGRRRSRPTGSH